MSDPLFERVRFGDIWNPEVDGGIRMRVKQRTAATPSVIRVGQRPPGDVWVFPWGVSVNHLYENTRGGGRKLTARAEGWKDTAITIVRCSQLWIAMEPKALHIRAYPPNAARRDGDNLIKLTQDAIAAAYEMDDSIIAYVGIEKCAPDKERPRIEAKLEAFTTWRERVGSVWGDA